MSAPSLSLDSYAMDKLRHMALLIELKDKIKLRPSKHYDDILTVLRIGQSTDAADIRDAFNQTWSHLSIGQRNTLNHLGITGDVKRIPGLNTYRGAPILAEKSPSESVVRPSVKTYRGVPILDETSKLIGDEVTSTLI